MTTKVNESFWKVWIAKKAVILDISRGGETGGGGAGLNMVTFAKSEKAANILSWLIDTLHDAYSTQPKTVYTCIRP